MDLHLIPGAEPTAEERTAIDAALGPPESAWDGAPRSGGVDERLAVGGRPFLVDVPGKQVAVKAAQARAGWISPGALNYVCRRLTVPPAEAFGVASFYAMLSTEPRPMTVAHVCDDVVCRVAGAKRLCDELARRLGPAGAGWTTGPCLGMCERAPAVLISKAGTEPLERVLAPAAAEQVAEAMRGTERAGAPGDRRPGSPSAPQTLDGRAAAGLRLLRRVGRVDPTDLDDYRAHGGYAALRRALALGPEGVLRELHDSRLTGRGGAAFPTGRKWEAVARAPARPHYVVCNADESEPGTFKDRILMEEDPFALIEAMTIAALATGSEHGYVYVRGEYPLAAQRLAGAAARARARGLLGDRIMGEPLRFDLEVRRGAGAYVCGEETALFNSIEGYRGEPRNKPPFPVQAGLFGRPTAINNVETLANVPDLVLEGGPAFAARGTAESSGTKLFCLSGCVERPGVYEVPFGATLRQLVETAGGVRAGRPLKAVLLGGAAGTFLAPDQLDTPLTLEATRAIGASLGSGAVMLFDDGVDLREIVLRIAAFFRDESCGQCVPCRVGTRRQEELLERLAAGRPLGSRREEAALLGEIGQAMRDASICGLGQTASMAAQSALEKLGLFAPEGDR